jgi:hypothetical protein
MLILGLWVVSFAFFFLGPIGIFMFCTTSLFLMYWAYSVYQESLQRYYTYMAVQQEYMVLKRKRYTILKEMFDKIGLWQDFEVNVLRKSGETSINATLLLERYPQIRTIALFERYLSNLESIEREINKNLAERIFRASEWFVMKDNATYNLFVPRKNDVPKDLRGEMFDPMVPEDGMGKY